MRNARILLALASSGMLAACGGGGGGGGGVASGGSVAPGTGTGTGGGTGTGTGGTSGGGGTTPTPAPTNNGVVPLTVSETFSAGAATTTTSINTSPASITTASTTRSTLQIRYDAGSRSYTVESQGRSQSFGPADSRTSTSPGETLFSKTNGNLRDYLTLVTNPYSGQTSNRYVGLGYWQRNTITTGRQDTTFDSFVYGVETAATAVPRTGTANYVTDTLGFVTTPGKVPRAFTGSGTFDIDLSVGAFLARASVVEYDLTTPDTRSGGNIQYTATGKLTSGNGFAGNFTYGGTDTRVSGTVSGKFFGPGAEELGATFSADNALGAAVSGSFTGQRSGNARANLSLLNVTNDQLFYTRESSYTRLPAGSTGLANTGQGISQMTFKVDGSITYNGASSNIPFGSFTAANKVEDGRASFVTYEATMDGRPARLSLYRPGPANPELKLTYASFGVWEGGSTQGYGAYNGKAYRAYGIETPRDVLSRRTGSAAYTGVVHATGIRAPGTEFAVGGTSRFDVDFSAQRFSGSLALTDTAANAAALGTWTFNDALAAGLPINTALRNGTLAEGTLAPAFYGPNADEIAATFFIQRGQQTSPDALVVVGATVAKQP
jgi:hypothetical protein